LPEYREWLLSMDRRTMLRLLDPGFGRSALFEGTGLIAALREIAGVAEDRRPADRLHRGRRSTVAQREVWLREGDMWGCDRASFAIPGLFTAATVIHGRALVDGGLLATLAIAATRACPMRNRLIAVGHARLAATPAGEPAESGCAHRARPTAAGSPRGNTRAPRKHR
jgi:NTE family protein